MLIDHEHAFLHIEDDPGGAFSLASLHLEAFFNHALIDAVDLATDLGPLFRKFASLPETVILHYLDGLPPEWLDRRAFRAIEYLQWARKHALEMKEFLESHIVR